MRIAILLTGFDGGGAQRRLLTLAREFLARGHAVDLVTGSDAGPFRHCAPGGATLVSLAGPAHALPGVVRRKSLRMLASLPTLVRYLNDSPPDVLLGGSTPANLAALAARAIARSGVPVAASVNVPLSRSTGARGRPLLGRLVRRLYPSADAVIANASFLAEDAARFAGLAIGRVTTIPNPVAVDEIQRAAGEPPSSPLLGDDAVPLVLAVGKLKAQKDIATLLDAFREVRDARPARLLVLGSGELHDELVRRAAALGLADDVRFAGFVANPFPYMARARVFVSSSRWEGFSNVVAEALACGCPVVATDAPGGVAELLGGGRFGRLVGVGDARAMARAILQTLGDGRDQTLGDGRDHATGEGRAAADARSETRGAADARSEIRTEVDARGEIRAEVDVRGDREALRRRAAEFSVARAADAYLAVLGRCCGLPAGGSA